MNLFSCNAWHLSLAMHDFLLLQCLTSFPRYVTSFSCYAWSFLLLCMNLIHDACLPSLAMHWFLCRNAWLPSLSMQWFPLPRWVARDAWILSLAMHDSFSCMDLFPYNARHFSLAMHFLLLQHITSFSPRCMTFPSRYAWLTYLAMHDSFSFYEIIPFPMMHEISFPRCMDFFSFYAWILSLNIIPGTKRR